LKILSLAFPASQFFIELANIGRKAVFHRVESEKRTIDKKKIALEIPIFLLIFFFEKLVAMYSWPYNDFY
jgi:hypothetical protein